MERNYSVLSNYTSSLVRTQSTLQAHLSYLMKLRVSAPEPERFQIENLVLIELASIHAPSIPQVIKLIMAPDML